MKVNVVFDVSNVLAGILLKFAPPNGTGEILKRLDKIQKEQELIMGAIDNLKAAVDANIQADSDGFAKISSAMEELASDIANLPQAADVQAEADRLSSNATTISAAFDDVSQKLRDALPTAPAEPPPAEAPAETAPATSDGGTETNG